MTKGILLRNMIMPEKLVGWKNPHLECGQTGPSFRETTIGYANIGQNIGKNRSYDALFN